MFRSPHTVALHLRRTYRKLDIASRVEPARPFLTGTPRTRAPPGRCPDRRGTRTGGTARGGRGAPARDGVPRLDRAGEGALVALGGGDPDEAWARLVRISQHTDTKVCEVAQTLLDAAARDGHRPRPDIAAAVRAELTLSAPPPDGTEPRDR